MILENAEQLISEAEILHNHEKWARSFFLSQVAAEELGKYMMVVSAVAFVIVGKMDWTLFWRRFRNHRAKFFNIHAMDNLQKIIESLSSWELPLSEESREEFRKKFVGNLSGASALREVSSYLRMEALYAEFDGSESYMPSRNFDEKVSGVLLALSMQRLEQMKWFDREVLGDGFLDQVTPEGLRKASQEIGFENFDYPKAPPAPPKFPK